MIFKLIGCKTSNSNNIPNKANYRSKFAMYLFN